MLLPTIATVQAVELLPTVQQAVLLAAAAAERWEPLEPAEPRRPDLRCNAGYPHVAQDADCSRHRHLNQVARR